MSDYIQIPAPSPMAIKAACLLHGGVSPISKKAGIDRANFLRWTSGASTLSSARVSAVFDALGLPAGKPDTTRVHHWQVRHGFGEWATALRVYFPNGAAVRRAPWSTLGREMLLNVATFRYSPEVFALTDGVVRAIVRAPTGVLLPVDALGPYLRWAAPSEEESLLDIGQANQDWLSGQVDIDQFNVKFGLAAPAPGMADVERLMQRHGLTPTDLIKLITDSI